LALLTLGCTATLEPTVTVGGEGGAGGDPLAACTAASSEANEYLLCTEPLAFTAAQHDCALRGATLAAITSAAEQSFVATLVAELNDDNWVGGTRTREYVWSWPDGTVFWRGGPDGTAEDGAYVFWKPGEPNNASTTSPDTERCLALVVTSARWNDRACELSLPYVCERP
jgi:hypothetical protein